MNSILNELWEAFRSELMSPRERAVLLEGSEIMEKAEKQMSCDDFDSLWEVFSRMSTIRAEENFALGFRLGVRIMLEVSNPAEPTRSEP